MFSVIFQFILPKKGLTLLAGILSRCRQTFLKAMLIKAYCRVFEIDLREAKYPNIDEYESFSEFFTRELKDDARHRPEKANAIASPADGTVSSSGLIKQGSLIQAKGKQYSVNSLLGFEENIPTNYEGGSYITIYLSPKDYHRVHAPIAGSLDYTIEQPGRLFSVNESTQTRVPNLFCRNERLICTFSCGLEKQYSLVMVGALIVRSIETTWDGPISPYRSRQKRDVKNINFDQGDQIGHFSIGSTVILLFPKSAGRLKQIAAGSRVQVGEDIGEKFTNAETQ